MKFGTRDEATDGKAVRKTAGLRGLASLTGIALAIASIVQELRKPRRKRTWHGALFERIPYDWRRPTAQRIRHAYWRPRSRDLLQPTVFGVGWSLNVAALLRPLARFV
jgi:hypothetical protein